jgi:predicted membrane-bound mannosyltransferase
MALAVVVRLRLLGVPLERDEGEFAYMGQLMLQGIPPYAEAYNMKLPGIYAAYALIMAAFGQTCAGIRLGLLLVNAATTAALFLLAKRLLGTRAALASACSFALISLSQSVLAEVSYLWGVKGKEIGDSLTRSGRAVGRPGPMTYGSTRLGGR